MTRLVSSRACASLVVSRSVGGTHAPLLRTPFLFYRNGSERPSPPRKGISMSCCPVGARAPVVVRAQSGARSQKRSMASLASVARRRWSEGVLTRGVALAAAAAGMPAVGHRTAAASLPVCSPRRTSTPAWAPGHGGRGYASNVFHRRNRSAPKAVAEPSSSSEAVEEERPIQLLTSDESEELLKIRHTTAHICAMATQKLFPNAQCTIGPWSVHTSFPQLRLVAPAAYTKE